MSDNTIEPAPAVSCGQQTVPNPKRALVRNDSDGLGDVVAGVVVWQRCGKWSYANRRWLERVIQSQAGVDARIVILGEQRRGRNCATGTTGLAKEIPRVGSTKRGEGDAIR